MQVYTNLNSEGDFVTEFNLEMWDFPHSVFTHCICCGVSSETWEISYPDDEEKPASVNFPLTGDICLECLGNLPENLFFQLDDEKEIQRETLALQREFDSDLIDSEENMIKTLWEKSMLEYVDFVRNVLSQKQHPLPKREELLAELKIPDTASKVNRQYEKLRQTAREHSSIPDAAIEHFIQVSNPQVHRNGYIWSDSCRQQLQKLKRKFAICRSQLKAQKVQLLFLLNRHILVYWDEYVLLEGFRPVLSEDAILFKSSKAYERAHVSRQIFEKIKKAEPNLARSRACIYTEDWQD